MDDKAKDKLVDEAIALTYKIAKEKGLGVNKSGAFEIECPICKGRIVCFVHAVNGHMHCSCTTKDCVRWME
jgi:hypothetical protein